MAQRANWKGYLKLSLVSCPVALFPASTASEKVSFHLLSGETGHRLKQQYVDAETGDIVERDHQVKGYETGKDEYITVTDDDLASVQIESSHTIDIDSFVPKAEIDSIYIDNHYYLVPDDKVGEEAFAVIREAMRHRDMVGIARVVLFGRERMVMVEPRAMGLMATTLHYAYEVRDDAAYCDDIPKVSLAKDLLELASHIIDTKVATFDPSLFKDRYQDAAVALLDAKKAGKTVAAPKVAKPSNVVNLMDALRRSLGEGQKAKEPGKAPSAAKGKRASPARKAAGAAHAKTKPASKPVKHATKPARRKAG